MIKDKRNRPVRDLRISVTDKCNFRCHYCMPEEIFGHKYEFLSKDKILTFEETTRLVKLFVQLGVHKIRITGGEPLLRQELDVLVKMLSIVSGIDDIAFTTNGYFLKEKAKILRDAGLKRLTVSLDTLDPELFMKMAGRHLELHRVLEGIDHAAELEFFPIKINTVLQRDVNDQEILKLSAFAKNNGHIIRFIEYMDVGNLNGWRMDDVVSAQEIIEVISSKWSIEPIDKNYKGEVANRYRYLDGSGEFGIIASVTQPFCGDCTRARLSADGKIYTCLFANTGFDVMTPMRDGASEKELFEMLQSLWLERIDRYSEERLSSTDTSSERKVEMYQIGG